MDKARVQADGVILVDAGDALNGGQVLPQQRARRAKLILDTYAALGLDAMATGEQDRGPEIDAKRIKGTALVTRAGIKVGIFSADLEATPAPTLESLAASARALRKRGAKLIVGLIHCGVQKVIPLLEPGGSGIDVVVASHSSWGTPKPMRAGGVWIVETPAQGKQIGRLDLHVLDGRLSFVEVGGRSDVVRAIADDERELQSLVARYSNLKGDLHDFFLRHKAEIEQGIADKKKLLAAGVGDPVIRTSWLENTLVNLGTDWQDAPRITALLKQYKKDVGIVDVAPPHGAAPGGTAAQTGSAAMPVNTAPVVIPGFTGGAACAKCHAEAFAHWQTTKHAKAWISLVVKEQQRDPACVLCHVTAGVASLPDVQCEACHGPGAQHAAQPNVKGLIARDAVESQCTGCHHAPQAKEWEYKSFRAAILGKGHGVK